MDNTPADKRRTKDRERRTEITRSHFQTDPGSKIEKLQRKRAFDRREGNCLTLIALPTPRVWDCAATPPHSKTKTMPILLHLSFCYIVAK